MKKLLLTAVIALATVGLNAQEKGVTIETSAEVQNPTQQNQDELKLMAKTQDGKQAFTEVKASQLPKAVLAAVAADFKGATVQNAYVNEKKEFKLVLQTQGAEKKIASKTVFVTADGKWIKKQQDQLKQ